MQQLSVEAGSVLLQGFVLFQVLLPLLLGAAALPGVDQAPQAPDEEHQDGWGHEQQQEPWLQSVRLRLSGSDLKLNFSLHVIFNNVKNVFPQLGYIRTPKP